jgi:hypothetical protein
MQWGRFGPEGAWQADAGGLDAGFRHKAVENSADHLRGRNDAGNFRQNRVPKLDLILVLIRTDPGQRFIASRRHVSL